MTDEPLGMRPGEDDGTDVRIAVGSGHQPVQLLGDVEAELLVRAAVDPDDQDGPAIFDRQTALVFVWHEFCSRAEFMSMGKCVGTAADACGSDEVGFARHAVPAQAAGDWTSA
jgi:hypothetical protein